MDLIRRKQLRILKYSVGLKMVILVRVVLKRLILNPLATLFLTVILRLNIQRLILILRSLVMFRITPQLVH